MFQQPKTRSYPFDIKMKLIIRVCRSIKADNAIRVISRQYRQQNGTESYWFNLIGRYRCDSACYVWLDLWIVSEFRHVVETQKVFLFIDFIMFTMQLFPSLFLSINLWHTKFKKNKTKQSLFYSYTNTIDNLKDNLTIKIDIILSFFVIDNFFSQTILYTKASAFSALATS